MTSIGAYYTFIVATEVARIAEQRRQELQRPSRPSLFDRLRALVAAKAGVRAIT
jgi:hypothetical protein